MKKTEQNNKASHLDPDDQKPPQNRKRYGAIRVASGRLAS
jgi:hypothetical protein